jgi:hypothetical protein
MSLPQAMRALQRGEIPRPPDHQLLVAAHDLPPMPTPAPKPDPLGDILFEQAVSDAADWKEMRNVLEAKRGRGRKYRRH